MAKQFKTLVFIISVGLLVYFASLGSVSVAGVGSAQSEERLEGQTISLEACLVRVAVEALKESVVGGDFPALSSVPAEALLGRVRAGDGEVVSGIRLTVAGGAVGEMTAEAGGRTTEKDAELRTGGHGKRQSSVSFRAEAGLRTAGRIAVEFTFKQVLSEGSSSGSAKGDREEEATQVFEVSSALGLEAGRPSVATARINGDEAVFLILQADI